MKEVWKTVKGYKGYYKVSNTGKILSLARWKETRRGVWHKTKDKLLKTKRSPRHDNLVVLWKPTRKWTVRVNHLVAMHFLRNPKKYPCVFYKTSSHSAGVDNLEWANEGHHRRIPINQINPETGKIIGTFESIAKASAKTGVNGPTICQALKGRRNIQYAGGYSWSRA